MKLHPMWQAYPALQNDLSESLQLMEQSLKLKNKAVEQAILAMLRPAYQLLFSEFGEEKDSQKAVALSAAIEMLHTASLIHDDIVDQADTRRSLPTIRAQFGNDVAVYAGDYLFVCCFKLLADYAGSLKSLQINSRSMETILAGELGQMSKRYDLNVTIEDYLENISGKTAELFALSCFIGAYESGASLRPRRCQAGGLLTAVVVGTEKRAGSANTITGEKSRDDRSGSAASLPNRSQQP